MRTRIFCLALVVCVLAVFVIDVGAQNKRLGTAGASELLIPVGGRDLAMGGSGIATSKGVEALFWNPAGISRMTYSAEGLFSYMDYIADIKLSYAAVAGNFGDVGSLAFSVKSMSFGDIALTTEDDPEGRTGRTYSPSYVTLGLGYSRALTDAISAGFQLKLISERIDLVSANGIAIDFGVQYSQLAGFRGLTFGVAVKNIGPQMKFDGPGLFRDALPSDSRRPEQKFKSEAGSFELPSSIELGLSYDLPVGERYVARAAGVFANNNLSENTYHFGGEIGYLADRVHLFARGGYNFSENATQTINGVDYDSYIYGASFGGGLTYMVPGLAVTIDYAWRDVKSFSANNIVSVKLGF